LKEHVSEPETVCGKIQKEMAEMVQREVKVARGFSKNENFDVITLLSCLHATS